MNNYDKIMQLKGFDKHCIHNHGKANMEHELMSSQHIAIASSSNNTNNNNTNNKIISNSNMSGMIIENDNVIGVNMNDWADNEYNKIIEKKDTDSRKIKSNSNVNGDSDVEIDKMSGNIQTCPNIDEVYERYDSFGLTYTYIHNDIYSYVDATRQESKLSWED